MSAPGGSSRLRIGGFALIGVGVVAGLVGFATAGSGGQTVVAEPAVATTAAAAPAAEPSTAPVAGPPAGATPAAAEVTAVSPSAAPPATRAAAPPARSAPARSGAGESKTGVRPAVRVLNNSTITGLAARAQQDLEAAGWAVSEVGNVPTRNLPTSTVFYGRGAGEQEAAARLAGEFGMQSQPAAADLPPGPPGLVVILTNDYGS